MPMSEVVEKPAAESLNPVSSPSTAPSVEVYAVYGVEPEIQAYAMAKYSRSALSMKESLREISQQKAEKFLNTFYFQYGHRSIADLAHIALAIERLSILAAIAVADEQRWDGQERSTRYQDFKKSGYYVPDFGDARVVAGDSPASMSAKDFYRETVDSLFTEYESLSDHMFLYLASITPKPDEMKQEAYERTLRARAFDISRYLLPLATNTSLGEIVNARTLESQVSHLLSHTHKEIRHLGELLKRAAISPAYNGTMTLCGNWSSRFAPFRRSWAHAPSRNFCGKSAWRPTLVKYADPNQYEIETRRALRQVASELMGDLPVAPAPTVDLLEEDPLEIELAATLIYEHSHYSYRQIRQAVQAAGEPIRREIIDLGLRHRGRHDEILSAFCAGQQFRFDILMDIGGFRDMHRHRRCIQIGQEFTTKHGYDAPEELEAAGARENYDAVMQRTASAVEQLAARGEAEARENSQVRDSAGIPQAHPVQDGFCRSGLHLRTPNRTRRSLLIPQCGLCDV